MEVKIITKLRNNRDHLEHCSAVHLSHHLIGDHHRHTKLIRQPDNYAILHYERLFISVSYLNKYSQLN